MWRTSTRLSLRLGVKKEQVARMCTRSPPPYRGATLNRRTMNPDGNCAPRPFPRMHRLVNKGKQRAHTHTLSLTRRQPNYAFLAPDEIRNNCPRRTIPLVRRLPSANLTSVSRGACTAFTSLFVHSALIRVITVTCCFPASDKISAFCHAREDLRTGSTSFIWIQQQPDPPGGTNSRTRPCVGDVVIFVRLIYPLRSQVESPPPPAV